MSSTELSKFARYVSVSNTGAISLNSSYTLPTTVGANNAVLSVANSATGELTWSTAAGGGITNIVEDTTPELGGDLSINGKKFILDGNLLTIYSTGGPGNDLFEISDGAASSRIHSPNYEILISTASQGIRLHAGQTNGYFQLSTSGSVRMGVANTGVITFNNSYSFPTSDGTGGQVLTTDGAGNLTFADASSFTVSLFHTLDNPNPYSTSADDNFGFSAAVSGNYAIVGAYFEDDASGSGSGKAYIYDVTTGALVHTLDNPNPYSTSANDNFGRSVAISGNYAIVGASYEDDAGGSDSGKAYIYNVTTGALVATLDNPNAYSTSAADLFGYSVGISGNYAIVSSRQEDDAGGVNSGKAYIFDVPTGALVHTLNNPNAYSTSASDLFGQSVAISGNYAIVGAYQEDDAGGFTSGKAYIFNVATGALVHTLDNPNGYSTSADDFFGGAVAISNSYAIVSAWNEDDADGLDSGKAYIFDVTTGALVHTLDNPNPYSTSASDRFGVSVAISGNYAIVGARFEDEAGNTDSGKVYIFDVAEGTLVATLDNPNAYLTSGGDYFGGAVAISGNRAIVGAYQEDDAGGANSGKAYIYQLPNAQPYVLDAAEAAGFGMSNLVQDSTPQLGGNLDTNGYTVGNPTGANFSFSSTRISTPVNKELYLSRSSLILTDLQDDEIKIKTPDNIPFPGYTLTLPTTAGSNGQLLTTDGSGTLSWSTPSSGISNIVEDTTPQLGGNLDTNGNLLVSGPTGSGVKIAPIGAAEYGLRVFAENSATNALISTYDGHLWITGYEPPAAWNNSYTVTIKGGENTGAGGAVVDIAGAQYGKGTVYIRASDSVAGTGAGSSVQINTGGNTGEGNGTTYIGSTNIGPGFYDNDVYIVDSKWPSGNTAFGTSGQVLTTDGAGTLSWSTPAGGSFADRYVAAILFS